MARRKCWRCGREAPSPVRGDDAAKHRVNFREALGAERGDMFAYAHCVTRSLMSEQANAMLESRSPEAPCRCELQAWEAACRRWQSDAAACWRDLGVTEEALVRAEVWRLRSLRRERTLSPEEKTRLKTLRKKLSPEEDAEIKETVASEASLSVKIHAMIDETREEKVGPRSPPIFEFKCPFCGRAVRAGGGAPEVLHELPACGEFLKNEAPDAFLRRCRERMTP